MGTIINNIYSAIESAPIDEAVGIRLVHLTGSDDFALFAAEIGPNKKVGAHYHESGLEIYQVVEGEGIIHIGKPDSNNAVQWTDSQKVTPGDCFTVNEGDVHQLVNIQNRRMLVIVGCAASHVTTDRIVTKGTDS